MLRLRRNLQPWISDRLVLLSAVLLLLSSLPAISKPEQVSVASTSPPASTADEAAMEKRQDTISTLQSATRQGIKISLLILGHH